jgi:hypothetical protein
MAWTAPKTWVVGEAVTAADLNAHIRDNLLALKAPPTTLIKLDESSDYTTTSTSFVAIDNTKLNLSITTTGGDVLIVFFANLSNSTSHVQLDVEFDGVAIGGDNGLIRVSGGSGNYGLASLSCLKQSVSAGTHSVRMMWKVPSGTGTLYSGTTLDIHPMFWVREV